MVVAGRVAAGAVVAPAGVVAGAVAPPAAGVEAAPAGVAVVVLAAVEVVVVVVLAAVEVTLAVLPAGEYLMTRTCPVVRNICAGGVVVAAAALFPRAPGPVTARARLGSRRISTRRQARRGVHFSTSAKNRTTLLYSSTSVKSRSA